MIVMPSMVTVMAMVTAVSARLPMMYLDDCLRSTVEYMLAPADQLSCRWLGGALWCIVA